MTRHGFAGMAAGLAFAIAGCATPPTSAPPDPRVVGVWRLLSFDTRLDGGAESPFWVKPEGHLVITPTRLTAVLVAGDRKQPANLVEAEPMAAAYKTVIAYTGRYRIEGDKLITTVDESAIPAWRGSEQGRVISFEGSHLVLTTVPAPFVGDPTKTIVARLVWERTD
jgi:hypothetical protein